jgi:hypothetical protein
MPCAPLRPLPDACCTTPPFASGRQGSIETAQLAELVSLETAQLAELVSLETQVRWLNLWLRVFQVFQVTCCAGATHLELGIPIC